MAVLIRINGTKEEVKPKNGKTFSFEELKSLMGGCLLECITLPNGAGRVICDEEGRLKGLPDNEAASKFVSWYGDFVSLCGDVLFVENDEIE